MDFVFTVCQIGAESALKREIAREHPELHFAYSRPGFLTFKFAAPHLPLEHFRLRSVFARAWGYSLGRLAGATPGEKRAAFVEKFANRPVHAIHVWQRDQVSPKDELPIGQTPAALQAAAILKPALSLVDPQASTVVADCVLVEPDEWWAGWHVARDVPQFWPGGQLLETLPEHAVSRGYLKMREMLLWSELPIEPNDVCVEFGSAPGGATQQLLECGLQVMGIDPAEMHPAVLSNPRFTHVQARPREMKKRAFHGVRWLVSDINLPPAYTLDTMEDIVRYPGVDLQGMLLTLKLPVWSLADEIPEYLDRVRTWGYKARTRQLHYNRQEICLAASR